MAAVLGDPALHTFIGGTPETPEGLLARYERLVAGPSDPTVSWLNWVVSLRAEGRLTGTVQATITPDPLGSVAEIAWVIGTSWQGRGIATEAAQGLVGWLDDRADVDHRPRPSRPRGVRGGRRRVWTRTDRARGGWRDPVEPHAPRLGRRRGPACPARHSHRSRSRTQTWVTGIRNVAGSPSSVSTTSVTSARSTAVSPTTSTSIAASSCERQTV